MHPPAAATRCGPAAANPMKAPLPTKSTARPLWRRFTGWQLQQQESQRRERALVVVVAAAASPSPSSSSSSSSRRHTVVDPAGTDYFLGPNAGARKLETEAKKQQDHHRAWYRRVESAPSAEEAVRLCLDADADADDGATESIGAEALCLALFRAAVAVSDGEAIGNDDDDKDPDWRALQRLQQALTRELSSSASCSAPTPGDAANVLWALASEASSPSAAARGRPAADASAVEALAKAVVASAADSNDLDDWQQADLVSGVWGAGTLLRALQPAPMPATRALLDRLAGALAVRWSACSGSSGVAADASLPPAPLPCAEDLADAAAGVAAAAEAAAAVTTPPPQQLLALLEAVSACLHAALCNRHSSSSSFGGSGGAPPGSADTAKLFSSLASAATLLLPLSPRASSSSAAASNIPSLPRAFDALAALVSQRARQRHRQMLSRPEHLAAVAKAVADLEHGSLAVPEMLRLLAHEAALGAAGADALPVRALTLAERQARKAAALAGGGGKEQDEDKEDDKAAAAASLPPERAPPTARWRPGQAADLLDALLRLGRQPPPLLCGSLAAAVLRGLREEEEEEEEGGDSARRLLLAFAAAGWHPGDELAERLLLRAADDHGDSASPADVLYAWAVLEAAAAAGPRRPAVLAAVQRSADALVVRAAAAEPLAPRLAVRGLWALAALGMLTRELYAALEPSTANSATAPLTDAQLAAVAEAALLLAAPAPSPARQAHQALSRERAEGRHLAMRVTGFAADADAFSARLLSCSWRRLDDDLAGWVAPCSSSSSSSSSSPSFLLLMLADQDDDEATSGNAASALDYRAGGGLLPPSPRPRALGGLAVRARLARREAAAALQLEDENDEGRFKVVVVPRQALRAAGEDDDQWLERLLERSAVPLALDDDGNGDDGGDGGGNEERQGA
jgi:hypothetical protein